MSEETIEAYEVELRAAQDLARRAGALVLDYYGAPLAVEHKGGELDEPVTQADHAANALIVNELRRLFPDDGILAEESADTTNRLNKRRVWMVDPLDGTTGFIDGNGDFAVQIGLAVDGESALGVVYLPVANALYWAARGRGAWALASGSAPKRLRVSSETDLKRMRLAVSRSHRSPRMNRVVEALGLLQEMPRGSVGIKIGLIVERECDLYIHLSPRTKQWDTCAPEIILREAGGRLTDLFGAPLRYNSPTVNNPNGLVATNGVAHAIVIEQLAPLLAEFGRVKI
jgi:3'(2'), 5'-bisphosphate nucleotidase